MILKVAEYCWRGVIRVVEVCMVDKTESPVATVQILYMVIAFCGRREEVFGRKTVTLIVDLIPPQIIADHADQCALAAVPKGVKNGLVVFVNVTRGNIGLQLRTKLKTKECPTEGIEV